MKAIKAASDSASNNTLSWFGAVGILLGVLGFLGAYLFNEVSAMPKVYETTEQHQRDMDKQDERQRIIEKKLDDGFDGVQKLILDLHKK